ncbi:MAG: hypothetical protein ABR573_05260, partial [Candidatus Dormibacteria bacterium]
MTSNPYPQFMQCLDSKGVNVFLQPEFNDGSAACMSWTDFTENCGPTGSWQPLSWMRSAWSAVQGGRFSNFRYAVNPFMVGNLFDIAGDGQSAIFSRDDARAGTGWYAGDRADALYNGAGVGTYTDRADDPAYRQFEGPRSGFLALTRWVIPESSAAAVYRCRPSSPQGTCPGSGLPAGDAGSLQSCEKGLAPGSGVTSGPCAENQYRVAAVVADLFPPPAAVTASTASPSTELPPTAAAPPWRWDLLLVWGSILPVTLAGIVWRRRRRPGGM